MKRPLNSIAVLVPMILSLPFTPSCGSSDDPATGTGNSNFVTTFCDLQAECCPVMGLKDDNGQNCRMFWGSNSPAKADECLTQVQKAKSDGKLCDMLLGKADSSSLNVCLSGKAAGEPCTSSEECAYSSGGMAQCAGDVYDGAGYCQEILVGTQGKSPCVTTLDPDESVSGIGSTATKVPQAYSCSKSDKLYCDDAAGVCSPVVEQNGACSGTEVCALGLYCNASKCVPKLSEGAACEESSACASKLLCATGTCKKGHDVGEACESASTCLSHACVNGKCLGNVTGGSFGGLVCGS